MGLSRYLPARLGSAFFPTLAAKGERRKQAKRRIEAPQRLHIEPLEPRMMLAAAGLVPVGFQPTGPLTGKIVYTSGGHGWGWNTTLNRWATDRGEVQTVPTEMIEDFGNQDQLHFFADYLLRAGATVVPMRPVGHQLNEVVLDNDSGGVTYTGSWSNNTNGPRWYDEDYGAVTDNVKYRFAAANASETAVATYTPTIPGEGGFYPVYTWVSHSANRTTQLYKINHTGGQTQVRIDHRMVGNGWVYLGTYHFNGGSSVAEGSVQISNQSSVAGNVIADAIRFGNGMGDVRHGAGGIGTGSISGYPREDENSLMWLWRSVGQSSAANFTPATVIGTGNVSAPSRMAEAMNADSNPFGTSVYIGFHSNAGGGRGAVGLIDADAGDRTPHQADLALYTGRQINQDMQALNGTFEHNWSTRTTHTYTGQFGEIDEGASAEMDMTIIEVAFHDSLEDAQLMRDPDVRDQLARSTYQAVLEYFDVWGGLNSPVSTPTAPTNVRAVSNGAGQVTVSWAAGPSTPASVNGAAATGYRIYASSNGYGFDGGTLVSGGGTTSATLSGYDPTIPYYFKVVAVNAGGESKASEVMAVVPTGGPKQVLIVNGFDRNDRTQNYRQAYPYSNPDGFTDRVRPRYNNTFDYVVQAASAIQAHAPGMSIDSTSNQMVASGAVNLSNYAAVIWILGEESTADETFSATEQTRVSNYLAAGGKLFVTGAELAWDLDRPSGPTAADRAFLNNVLRTDYVADDANTYTTNPAAGSIFAGLPAITFDNGTRFYDVDTPDRIAPINGATTALAYSTGGAAGIQYADPVTGSKVVVFGFPFETITTANLRNQVMGRVLDYFAVTELPDQIETILDNDSGPGVYSETGSWQTASAAGYNGLTYRFATAGTAATATWQFYAPFAGHAELYVQHRAGSNRADNATFSINTGSSVGAASVNQKTDELVWVPLGEFYFQEGVRTITLNAQTSTGGSVVLADAIKVVLFNAPPPTGDFNDDGVTDGADFLVWQRNVARTDPELAHGDGNGDRLVDGDDLALWTANFGSQTAAAQGGSAAAGFASLTLETSAAETGLDPSASLINDMAAIAQRVAASAALERFGVRKPIARDVFTALADERRQTPASNRAADLAYADWDGGEQQLPRRAAGDAGRGARSLAPAGLDAAFQGRDAWSWRDSI